MTTFKTGTSEEIATTVRAYLTESFLSEAQAANLGLDDELLTVLDSLHLLRMIVELESQFGVTIDNSELTLENLGTLNRIGSFIHGKLN